MPPAMVMIPPIVIGNSYLFCLPICLPASIAPTTQSVYELPVGCSLCDDTAFGEETEEKKSSKAKL